jgi:acetate kinase
MTLVVLNVGSSSVKYAVFAMSPDGPREIGRALSARATRLARAGEVSVEDRALIGSILDTVEREHGAPVAVGHRVVHGGRAFLAPALIDDETLAGIEALAPLAPLHQPHNTMAIRAVESLRPGLPQVACFDTAFHRTQPELHRRLPLPESFFEQGVERYGFHGLSYSWLVQELARLRGGLPKRMLAFHLGAGASACALLDGRSQDTSMGFSTLDGLMMGTRPGALDAGVLLHLMELGGTHEHLVDLLYTRCGLLGVSGRTADMKTLLASTDPAAQMAVAMFCQRAAAVGAGLVASLGGLDAVVFTGGIGEHGPEIRARIGVALAFLGVAIDPARNAAAGPRVSPDGAAVECWVVKADEEMVIAQAVAALVSPRPGP